MRTEERSQAGQGCSLPADLLVETAMGWLDDRGGFRKRRGPGFDQPVQSEVCPHRLQVVFLRPPRPDGGRHPGQVQLAMSSHERTLGAVVLEFPHFANPGPIAQADAHFGQGHLDDLAGMQAHWLADEPCHRPGIPRLLATGQNRDPLFQRLGKQSRGVALPIHDDREPDEVRGGGQRLGRGLRGGGQQSWHDRVAQHLDQSRGDHLGDYEKGFSTQWPLKQTTLSPSVRGSQKMSRWVSNPFHFT